MLSHSALIAEAVSFKMSLYWLTNGDKIVYEIFIMALNDKKKKISFSFFFITFFIYVYDRIYLISKKDY